MKLMTLNQYMKMSRAALIRKITKQLRTMSKAKLARLCYTMAKSKLPRLKTIRQRQLTSRPLVKRRTKRRASPKQIAWRKEFAKRAKAGTFRRKQLRARGKRRFD